MSPLVSVELARQLLSLLRQRAYISELWFCLFKPLMKCSIFVPSVGNWMCKLWPAEWGKAILMSDCLCHYLLRAEHISLAQLFNLNEKILHFSRKCMHLSKIVIIYTVSHWKPCDVEAQVSTNTGRVFRRNPHLAGFNFKVHVAMQPMSPSSSPISAQWLVTCLTQHHTNSKHFKPVWLLNSLHLFYFLACPAFVAAAAQLAHRDGVTDVPFHLQTRWQHTVAFWNCQLSPWWFDTISEFQTSRQ